MQEVHFDQEELELLALALDQSGAANPLIDISWFQGWREGLVSAKDIVTAAREELSLDFDPEAP